MASRGSHPQQVAINNVRVFDGVGIGTPTTVYIDNGLISEVIDDADFLDGENGILVPGFIDAHIHLCTEVEQREMARHGVTTALDMATWSQLTIEALRGLSGVTDFRTAGKAASAPGSIHSAILPVPAECLLTKPEQAQQFVQARLAENVDYIKIVADIPGPDQAVMDAVVTEAHKVGKLVVAHAADYHPFKMAQEARVDIVTHCPCDQALNDEDCARMVQDGRVCVPTLTMMEATTSASALPALLRMFSRPWVILEIARAKRKAPRSGKREYKNARDSVVAMHRAGVTLIAGTDAHKEDSSPFKVKHGDSLHHEFELLVDAGLSTVEVMQAATSLPANHFGLTDRGAIEIGKRADLVLLERNPIEDIRHTRSIKKVWCAGVEVDMT
ncbi:hypothetical protein LTR10_014556 [Elasticomyces elasticus]|uniref:Amidohydrolase-related domain-containing protein n=1 Tax=Exophiala sideris TaxID=1016849 RepID=A0ABR0JSE8_9EURO|nr:hypothetical protein LTR10_014556 [Elasticomyces elasticus]KAK5040535.1 hypothetical protein LTS07_001033 [Exophiala sideris]KAK5043041.1 hypothetical protein LTR13_000812 [Exophiala sideris]KAK5068913.1 hypothetical protein LTR69_001034 [Exophiala sideris]KAK5186509.1 hypothetical protein LTR44_001565 [Eurotiomycetes sp. CCFEE 6388]